MEKIEFSIYQPMISGQGEAVSRKYHLFVGKSKRRWLVADQPNAADNIYVEGKKGSDGFGGATLKFELVDGTVLSLTGPWKTGADGLLADTGHDVTDRYLTRGIVAFTRESQPYPKPDIFSDIVHHDTGHVLGQFDRIDHIAQAAANESGRKVWFSTISGGGGHAAWKHPEKSAELT